MNDQSANQPPKPVDVNKEANQWAMFVHFSVFAGYFLPIAGLVLPIILWQVKRTQYPFVDINGKNVVNYILSFLIYTVVCLVLSIILIGIVGLAILGVLAIIFPIVGGIKASQGEAWVYPLTIKFL